jgi:hypothetical protein
LATRIVIPAYSHILNIQFLTTVAWNGVAATISIGTSATSTQLAVAHSLAAIGVSSAGPGTDATRTALWMNVGSSDVVIYALSANTGDGVGELIVRYLQAENA